MKKNLFLVWACIVVSILFNTTSCASTGASTIHQDPSFSWQEHALLLPSGNARGIVDIRGFYEPNQKDSYLPLTIKPNEVGLIPPGKQTINVVVKPTGYEQTRPFQITYEFLPGQRYVISIVNVKKGLLVGSFSAEIHTVDEYRSIYEEIYPNNDESSFKSWVLDRFDKAETWLKENK